ncbi:MAG: hypothetical protein QXD49_00530 [Archaeoglobaceae archaeon]
MAFSMGIRGKVCNVGYRLFLLKEADSFLIPCFNARNEKEQVEQFLEFVKSKKPEEGIL